MISNLQNDKIFWSNTFYLAWNCVNLQHCKKVSKFFWKNEHQFLEKEWLSRLFIIKVYHWNKCCQVLYFNDDPRHEEKMCIDKMSNFSSLISSVFLIGFLSILNPCFVTSVKGKACKNFKITLSKIVFSYHAF